MKKYFLNVHVASLWSGRLFVLLLLLFPARASESLETQFNQAQRLAYEGKYEESFQKAESGFAEAEKKLNPDDPVLAKFLNLLADLYLNRGKPDISLAYHERALAIRRGIYGDTHYDVAESLNNLGISHFAQKQYAEAENCFSESLAICEKIFVSTHPSLAYPLENLGKLYRETGRYVEAEAMFERAIKIRDKARVPASLLASSLQNEAKLYLLMGAYAKAEPLLSRALKIQDARLKRDHPIVLELCRSLAEVHRKLGHEDLAQKYSERAPEGVTPESPA